MWIYVFNDYNILEANTADALDETKKIVFNHRNILATKEAVKEWSGMVEFVSYAIVTNVSKKI